MATGFRIKPQWRLRPFTLALEASASLALLKRAKPQRRFPIQALLARTCGHLELRYRARRALAGHSHLPLTTMHMGEPRPCKWKAFVQGQSRTPWTIRAHSPCSVLSSLPHMTPSLRVNSYILCQAPPGTRKPPITRQRCPSPCCFTVPMYT